MISRKGFLLVCALCVAYVLMVVITQRAGYDVITCPSRLVYDLPCAGCGGTRAFLLLIKGHPIDAFMMNPNIYLAVPLFLAVAGLMAYDMRHHTDKLNFYYSKFKEKGNRPKVYIPVLLFEMAVWGYNIWRYKHGEL